MKIILIIAISILTMSNVFAQTITNYTTTDGLLNDNVICVDVDASDNIWFGTQDGVSVFDGVSTWTNHTTSTDAGLVDNTIQAIYVTNSGDVWVGTDFGVSIYNGSSWTAYTTTDGLGNNQVKCITEDANGDIWFGTNNGASKFDGATTWVSYGTAEGLPFGGVFSIDVHSNGDVWMGSGLGGMMIFDGAVFTIITTTDGLIDDRIRGMVIDQQDNKWIGTSEGITVLNTGNTFSMNHTTMFTLPAPDTLNPIEDIEMDSQGNIWVGVYVDYLVTEGGVCAYNGNQWAEYTVSDGLVGPVVRALGIDGNDDVWVATSTGVSKIHDASLDVVNQVDNVQFEMYPNPANDNVNISFDGNNTVGNFIELYDTSMKLMKTVEVLGNQNNLTFFVGDLERGMYFVLFDSKIKKLILN